MIGGRIIIIIIGVFIRYLFYKITGKPKTISFLYGENNNLDLVNQHIMNWIVGTIVFCSICAFIAYLVFS